jgi:hypothetical protein
MQGQPMQGQPMQGQPMQGQPMQGQPPPGYRAGQPGAGPMGEPIAYPHPVAPLPGQSCLVISVNRGPYLVPVATAGRLKVDRRQVTIPREGTWYVPVPAGTHDVRYTDFLGVPMVTTQLATQPGAAHQLSFRFGAWRNRVFDGQGTDVTKFGMWSNYTIMLITFAVLIVFGCGGLTLITALAASNS